MIYATMELDHIVNERMIALADRYPNRTVSGCYEVMLDVCVFGLSLVRTHVRPPAYNTAYSSV